MLINYLLEKDEDEYENTHESARKKPTGKNERIRVNDRTATGGWF